MAQKERRRRNRFRFAPRLLRGTGEFVIATAVVVRELSLYAYLVRAADVIRQLVKLCINLNPIGGARSLDLVCHTRYLVYNFK